MSVDPTRSSAATGARLDPRGLRTGAAITSVVLALALALAELAPAVSTALLLGQAVVFALGVGLGPARTPYGLAYARLVRPRLGPPAETEDAGPPRFAQGVGLAFVAVALVGTALGAGVLTLVATGLALVAALLNAAVGLCLGCEAYLIVRRLAPRQTAGA